MVTLGVGVAVVVGVKPIVLVGVAVVVGVAAIVEVLVGVGVGPKLHDPIIAMLSQMIMA